MDRPDRKAGIFLVLTALTTIVAVVGRVAADADQDTLAEFDSRDLGAPTSLRAWRHRTSRFWRNPDRWSVVLAPDLDHQGPIRNIVGTIPVHRLRHFHCHFRNLRRTPDCHRSRIDHINHRNHRNPEVAHRQDRFFIRRSRTSGRRALSVHGRRQPETNITGHASLGHRPQPHLDRLGHH